MVFRFFSYAEPLWLSCSCLLIDTTLAFHGGSVVLEMSRDGLERSIFKWAIYESRSSFYLFIRSIFFSILIDEFEDSHRQLPVPAKFPIDPTTANHPPTGPARLHQRYQAEKGSPVNSIQAIPCIALSSDVRKLQDSSTLYALHALVTAP